MQFYPPDFTYSTWATGSDTLVTAGAQSAAMQRPAAAMDAAATAAIVLRGVLVCAAARTHAATSAHAARTSIEVLL